MTKQHAAHSKHGNDLHIAKDGPARSRLTGERVEDGDVAPDGGTERRLASGESEVIPEGSPVVAPAPLVIEVTKVDRHGAAQEEVTLRLVAPLGTYKIGARLSAATLTEVPAAS